MNINRETDIMNPVLEATRIHEKIQKRLNNSDSNLNATKMKAIFDAYEAHHSISGEQTGPKHYYRAFNVAHRFIREHILQELEKKNIAEKHVQTIKQIVGEVNHPSTETNPAELLNEMKKSRNGRFAFESFKQIINNLFENEKEANLDADSEKNRNTKNTFFKNPLISIYTGIQQADFFGGK